MSAHAIATKFRRALRNETGVNFTYEQLRQLGEYGILRLLAEIEAEELCPAKKAHTGATHIGSKNAATDVHHIGKSRGMSAGQSYIEALAR